MSDFPQAPQLCIHKVLKDVQIPKDFAVAAVAFFDKARKDYQFHSSGKYIEL